MSRDDFTDFATSRRARINRSFHCANFTAHDRRDESGVARAVP